METDNNQKTAVLWGGRTSNKPEEAAFAFQASIHIDKRLAQEDITGSRAHVKMLGKQGIIPPQTAAALDGELECIALELERGTLHIDENAEDIHSFIEGELTARLGTEGRMVHAGRSRNDQVALDFRLYLKNSVPCICKELDATARVLLNCAEEHLDSIMPGYTHLQRAQPVTLAHHLCAWVSGIARDLERFYDALKRLDECPLGSGALAGSGLPLDRAMTSAALGFTRPTINSMDAVADRDFALELASAAAITQTHLSRFCEDIVLWASEEFKFIDLDEAWSTGSSIMPQKKNPDFAELIRGKSARVTGNLITLFTLLKGLPYAYDKDLQEDKEALFDSLDTVSTALKNFRGMLASSRWNIERMETACSGGFLEATDAAEYLVGRGLPFRNAHEIVAHIVRECIENGLQSIAECSLDTLRRHSPLFNADIFERLHPRACVAARSLPGGPARAAVICQIAELRARLDSLNGRAVQEN
ncbi:MAG: argininosuccinate lyase [Spirochaetaceae bacterium]|jgi:argininosuccinate lyase|nr:argininosuccinate lyase [Spirochaetaceae bacterium]